MRCRQFVPGLIIPCVMCVLVFAGNVQACVDRSVAYIDPGTGSLILQVLISSFVAGVFLVKMFWQRIKGFVSLKLVRSKKGEQRDE